MQMKGEGQTKQLTLDGKEGKEIMEQKKATTEMHERKQEDELTASELFVRKKPYQTTHSFQEDDSMFFLCG